MQETAAAVLQAGLGERLQVGEQISLCSVAELALQQQRFAPTLQHQHRAKSACPLGQPRPAVSLQAK